MIFYPTTIAINSGSSDIKHSNNNPTATENLAKGTIWVNDATGQIFVCTDDTKDNNKWVTVGTTNDGVVHRNTDPTKTENLPQGTVWVNDETGQMFVCTDNTKDNNVWEAIPLIVHNTTDPTASENLPQGTVWVNDTTGQIFICKDDTQDNNVWQAIPLDIGEGGAKHSDNDPTITENLPKGTVWINDTTGQIYVCVNDTQDDNVWWGYKPTIRISSKTTDIVDIFGDGSAVATYNLDGDANDLGGKYNGSVTGSPQYPDAKFGKGIQSSSNDIQVTIPLNYTVDIITVSFWWKWGGVDAVMPIGFDLYNLYTIDNKLGFNTGHSDVYGISNTVDTSAFVHIVAEFHDQDVGSNKLWINGEAQTLSKQEDNNYSNDDALIKNEDFHILGWGGNSNHKDAGIIDQVRLFNRALTDDEVNKLYQEQ